MLADGKPVSAAAAGDKMTDRPIQHRTWRMARWFQNTVQEWINENEIKILNVNIEMPFMRSETDKDRRGVVTLMTQMRMIAAYEDACMRLEGCDVLLGEPSNSTVKAVFTGTGAASKNIMITFSAWNRRPDVKVREHLADAQGIGTCYPATIRMNADNIPPVPALYVDNEIGVGPEWKGKL